MNSDQDNGFDEGRPPLIRLSVLTNISLFMVINGLLVGLLVHTGSHVTAPSTTLRALRAFIWTSAAAAIGAAIAAPFLISTFARMQQRLTRQNNELRSLHAIDTAISSELKLGAILQVAVRYATLAVEGEMGALWLFAEYDRAHTAAEAFHKAPATMEHILRQAFMEGPDAPARRLTAAECRNEIDRTWSTDDTASALKLRNTIMVPIKQMDRVLGAFVVANRTATFGSRPGFTNHDQDLLNAVATTVAVAVQNARLYEETERRGGMLRSLVSRIGEALVASADASLLMQILSDEAARIMGCVRVGVYEADDVREQFLPLAATSDDRKAIDLFFRQPFDKDVLLPSEDDPEQSESVDGYYINVRERLRLASESGAFLDKPGYLFVLRSGDRDCIGLLCMLDAMPRSYTEEAQAFALALASQAAVAMENSRLHAWTRSLLAQARAVQDATNKIAAELDVDRVLEGVMDSARSVLDAEGYAIWDRDSVTGRWIKRAGYGLGFTLAPADSYPPSPSESDEGSQASDSQSLRAEDAGAGREPPQGQIGREAHPHATDAPREVEILELVLRDQNSLVISNTAHAAIAGSLQHGGHRTGTRRGGNVRALLALPLVYGGKTTGVMALYYRTPRNFLPEEVALAQSFAHQAANALENARLFMELNRLYEREKRIAGELQRSLLPPIPPEAGEFEIAHRYQAALDEAVVGGDFLDLFFLAPQKIALVIADVSGKGLPAAVQTAMIKYTLRAFAAETPDNPAEVLGRVNRVLDNPSTAVEGFVTVFYGVLDAQSGVLVYANAGHELPLLCDGDTGWVFALPSVDGMALGCIPDVDFENHTVIIDPGNTILLYTDGLTEARSPTSEFLTTDGLRRLMTCGEKNAESAIQSIYEQVRSYAGGVLRDDVAMLLLQRKKRRAS